MLYFFVFIVIFFIIEVLLASSNNCIIIVADRNREFLPPNQNESIKFAEIDHKSNYDYKYRNIAFTLVNVNSGKIKRDIHSFIFPFESVRFYKKKLNNLIVNSKNSDIMFFFEHTNSFDKFLCVKIKVKENLKIALTCIIDDDYILKQINGEKGKYSCFDSIRYSGIDTSGEKIISNFNIINIRDKRQINYELTDINGSRTFNELVTIISSSYLNDQKFMIQVAGIDNKNYLVFVDDSGKCKKNIRYDYCLPQYPVNYIYPTGVSCKGDKIVFISNNQVYKNEKGPKVIRLTEFDIANNEFRNIIDFDYYPGIIPNERSDYDTIMKFCPKNNSLLVAANLTSPTIIIDIDKKKIIRRIETTSIVKSLRWSPDGKKIGILDWDGELYIYDLEKDFLKKIAEDQDYFDFIWVNREKNTIEKVIEKVKSFFGK